MGSGGQNFMNVANGYGSGKGASFTPQQNTYGYNSGYGTGYGQGYGSRSSFRTPSYTSYSRSPYGGYSQYGRGGKGGVGLPNPYLPPPRYDYNPNPYPRYNPVYSSPYYNEGGYSSPIYNFPNPILVDPLNPANPGITPTPNPNFPDERDIGGEGGNPGPEGPDSPGYSSLGNFADTMGYAMDLGGFSFGLHNTAPGLGLLGLGIPGMGIIGNLGGFLSKSEFDAAYNAIENERGVFGNPDDALNFDDEDTTPLTQEQLDAMYNEAMARGYGDGGTDAGPDSAAAGPGDMGTDSFGDVDEGGGIDDAGTGPDGGYGDGGESGPGDGDPKVVCTAMNATYGFGTFRQAIWLDYAAKNLSKAHEVGYHAMFIPIVNYLYYSKPRTGLFAKALKWYVEGMVRRRTADIWRKKKGKKHPIGHYERKFWEPLCYIVGKIKLRGK